MVYEYPETDSFGNLSRNDIRDSLHTFFRSQSRLNQSNSTKSNPIPTLIPHHVESLTTTKQIYSYLLVQKQHQPSKTSASVKPTRLFGNVELYDRHYGKKLHVLCVTLQNRSHLMQLYYLRLVLTSTFSIDIRGAWDLKQLITIENTTPGGDSRMFGHHISSSRKDVTPSFRLGFDREAPLQPWILAEEEKVTALPEFLWSLSALAEKYGRGIPDMIRMNLTHLNDVAQSQKWPEKYNIEDKIFDALRRRQSTLTNTSDSTSNQNEALYKVSKPKISPLSPIPPIPITHTYMDNTQHSESQDVDRLLANVNWLEEDSSNIEARLQNQLQDLENENIRFLLSLDQGNNNQVDTDIKEVDGSSVNSVIEVFHGIDAVLCGSLETDDWTTQRAKSLEQTAIKLQNVEQLNAQLELYFQNSSVLHDTLENILKNIELSEEHTKILYQTEFAALFQQSTQSETNHGDGKQAITQSQILEAIKKLDKAIKATDIYPAKDMLACKTHRSELIGLMKNLCTHIVEAFEATMQKLLLSWKTKYSTVSSDQHSNLSRSSMSGGQKSYTFNKSSSSESSTSEVIEDNKLRFPRMQLSTFKRERERKYQMNWEFNNQFIHDKFKNEKIKDVMAILNSLNSETVVNIRQIYLKHMKESYGKHLSILFHILNTQLPIVTKQNPRRSATKSDIEISLSVGGKSKLGGAIAHIGLPGSHTYTLHSWSSVHNSSTANLSLSGCTLLQQALEHYLPLVLNEQNFLQQNMHPELYDCNTPTATPIDIEIESITQMLEDLFPKLLKRLVEFGDIAANLNILDTIGIIGLVNGSVLASIRKQSDFIFQTLHRFQLHMKRHLAKFTHDHETWISGHNLDGKIVGVLRPIQKTMLLISRMEESGCGVSDEWTLSSVYHKLLRSTFQWLEKVSETNAKYMSLIRLENYQYLSEKLESISSNVGLPLMQYAEMAAHSYEVNCKIYTASAWAYGFRDLVSMFTAIEDLLKTIEPADIQFHIPRSTVQKLLQGLNTQYEATLSTIRNRLKKHFPHNKQTEEIVLKRLILYGTECWINYERIAFDCYQLNIQPSSIQMKQSLENLHTHPTSRK